MPVKTMSRPLSGDGSSGEGLPRWLEILAATTGLVVLAPLFLGVALAVKLGSRGPVFFRQPRAGRGGCPFTLVKFRTMRADSERADEEAEPGLRVTVRGDPRVTAVGRFLRRTKLDELPELLNVLRGEMSLVGPRPEVPEYVDVDNPLWRRVLAARPGLTDPTTLELRGEEKLLASVEDPRRFYRETLLPYKLLGQATYLERRSGRSDVAVLLQTVGAIFRPSRTPCRETIEAVIERAEGAEGTERA